MPAKYEGPWLWSRLVSPFAGCLACRVLPVEATVPVFDSPPCSATGRAASCSFMSQSSQRPRDPKNRGVIDGHSELSCRGVVQCPVPPLPGLGPNAPSPRGRAACSATNGNMRREERVTVQGPVKKQQPGGMSHRGYPPLGPPAPQTKGYEGGGGGEGQPLLCTLHKNGHTPQEGGFTLPWTPRVTFRRVVVSLRGPGQSPVLPFACCVGSLLSVGHRGRCSCWCRCRVHGAQWLVWWGCAGCGGMCRLRISGAQ